MKTSKNNKNIDEQIIQHFHGELRRILDKELGAGNRVAETWHGDWPCSDVWVVSLEYPFKSEVQKNLDGIEFRNINDPHYWKAEYYDSVNNLLLVCRFGGKPEFGEL